MPDAATWLSHLGELPFVTPHIPKIAATIKQVPEDFCVEEIPSYLPSGEGEHLYVFFEKRGLNTAEAVRAMAHKLGARSDEAGWAGLKDRQAVTRQWVSLHHAATPSPEAMAVGGVRVLEVSRHANKLRTGHLRGNRFTLRLREVPVEHDPLVSQAMAMISVSGLPNYYGQQRFGREGRNLSAALRWIVGGEPAPQQPFLRKLYVSTLQSGLLNLWLAGRVRSGTLSTAIPGDVMRKEETGGLFDCTDAELDQSRVTNWEVSPTGPMFGSKMRPCSGEAKRIEDDVLNSWEITADHFERVKRCGEGTRRVARVRPEGFSMERDGTSLLVRFELPKGSYATVLISELLKSRAIGLSDDA